MNNTEDDPVNLLNVDKLLGSLKTPDDFSSEDKSKLSKVLVQVLSGLRDLGYSFLENKANQQVAQNNIISLVKKLKLRSSVIYLTPDQQSILKSDNKTHMGLLDIKDREDEIGYNARICLEEIHRCQDIVKNSIAPIEKGFIKEVIIDQAEGRHSYNCFISYVVPFPYVLKREFHYSEALCLAEKDLKKKFLENKFDMVKIVFNNIQLNSSDQLIINASN